MENNTLMNTPQTLQYLGITLLMGASVATIFTLIFWLILPLSTPEGIDATAFFTTLTTIGLYITKNNSQTNPNNQKETEIEETMDGEP
jgi:hypothetical protein